jgi:hypothetical protein
MVLGSLQGPSKETRRSARFAVYDDLVSSERGEDFEELGRALGFVIPANAGIQSKGISCDKIAGSLCSRQQE